VLRLTLRNLVARKLRLVMSALAIVLGVAFLAGVLIFSHGLGNTFDNIIKGSTPDAVIRPVGMDSFGQSSPSTLTVTPADVAKLAALPQVARADGSVEGAGMFLLDTHNKLVGGQGAPTLAFNRSGTPNMLGEPVLELRSGRWPQAPDEVVLARRAAERAGYSVGDSVRVIAPQGDPVRTLRLVGTADFNGGGTAGAILVIFDTPGAQQLFLGGRDAFTTVNLTAADGVSQTQLVDAAKKVLPFI